MAAAEGEHCGSLCHGVGSPSTEVSLSRCHSGTSACPPAGSDMDAVPAFQPALEILTWVRKSVLPSPDSGAGLRAVCEDSLEILSALAPVLPACKSS